MKKCPKAVILAACTLQILGLVVMTPVLAPIAQELGAGEVLMKTLVTLPAVFALAVSQISGWLTNFLPKKSLILTGLLFFFIGGMGGYFVHSIPMLLLCRVMVGVGLGLFYFVNVSLVTDCYEGEERTSMMGKTQAVNYLGGVIATLLAGVLAAAGWRNVFLLYFAALIVLVVDLLFLPTFPAKKNGGKSMAYHILPAPVYALALGALLQMIIFYACVTNLSDRLDEAGVAGGFLSSICVAAVYLGCFSTGNILSGILRLLGRWTVSVAVGGMFLGCILVFAGNSYFMILAGAAVVGISDGILIPAVYAASAGYATQYSGQVTATIACGISLGQFAAPLCFAALRKLTPSGTVAAGFGALAIGLAVIGIGLTLAIAGKTKRTVSFPK